MTRFSILAAAAVALLIPASASASTVHVGRAPAIEYWGVNVFIPQYESVVRYDAAPGEANRLTIDYPSEPDGQATVIVTDPGATIHPGFRCQSLNQHAARCRNEVG